MCLYVCVCEFLKTTAPPRDRTVSKYSRVRRVALYLFSKYDVLSSGYQYEGAGDSMSLNFIPVWRAKRCERGRNLHEIATFESFPTSFSQLICYRF